MKHIERHFSGNDAVRDVVIGIADGLAAPEKPATALPAKDHPGLPFLGLAGRQLDFHTAFSKCLRGTALCGVVTNDEGKYE
jgi:hypothetical protein